MILRRLEKILTHERHFRSTWPLRAGFRKMLQLDISYYHTKYHRDTTWRFEDIRSRNYNELYRKNFKSPLWRHFRSDRYETKLFFHRFQLCTCIENLKEIRWYLRKLQIWRFWCNFRLQNATGTGSCLALRILYKKFALVSTFQCTNFHSNWIMGRKDITVWAISRLCVYFRNRECYRKNSKNHFYYSYFTHPVQISAL